MNRIYHARIVWYHYIYFVLLLGLVVTFFLENVFNLGVLFALWMIYMVEKTFHTQYTITPDGKLIIAQGIFFKKKVIPIREITMIDERHMLKISGIAVSGFILIKHNKKYYSLLPGNGTDFVDLLTKNSELTF